MRQRTGDNPDGRARRHSRVGRQPGARGALERAAHGRQRRGRDPRGIDRGRPVPRLPARPRRSEHDLHRRQPGQARHRAEPEAAGSAHHPAQAGGEGRHPGAELHARAGEGLRRRLRDDPHGQPGDHPRHRLRIRQRGTAQGQARPRHDGRRVYRHHVDDRRAGPPAGARRLAGDRRRHRARRLRRRDDGAGRAHERQGRPGWSTSR